MRDISSGESFIDFYEDDSIYIDKTKEIYSLIKYKRAFFSRPRRFGKSTVLDTIATLFENGIEPYFKDTWIYDKWTEKTYPVLRLNFLKYSVNDFDLFSQVFCSQIEDFANSLELKNFKTSNVPAISMMNLLEQAKRQDKRIVILIDEYDCQLTANINNLELYDTFQKCIRSIYAVMKGEKAIKFLGITGITRLKDVSIFSVGSDIKDVSYYSDLATLVGFTREEIKKYYIDYINLAASIQNNISLELVTEAKREEVLDRLAQEYNGYCFDESYTQKVFSTWSINEFFTLVKNKQYVSYGDYWYGNGGIPSILKNYLESHDLDIKRFENEEIIVNYDNFSNPTSLLTMDQDVLMCQTGYLTICTPYESGTTLKLKIPNYEVKKALYRLLSFKTFGVEAQLDYEYKQLLEHGTVQDIFNIFNKLVKSVSYEKYPLTNESVLRSFLQAFLIGVGLRVLAEHHNSKGRSDLEIDYFNRRIVIELKFAKDSTEVQAKLKTAVQQIKERDYGNTLPRTSELLRIALIFDGIKKEFATFETV